MYAWVISEKSNASFLLIGILVESSIICDKHHDQVTSGGKVLSGLRMQLTVHDVKVRIRTWK